MAPAEPLVRDKRETAAVPVASSAAETKEGVPNELLRGLLSMPQQMASPWTAGLLPEVAAKEVRISGMACP
jgi:hypothetical protein